MYNKAVDNVYLSLDTCKEMVMMNFWSTKGKLPKPRGKCSDNIIGLVHAPDATDWYNKLNNANTGGVIQRLAAHERHLSCDLEKAATD